MWKRTLAERGSAYRDAVLSVVGADGYPSSARCAVGFDHAAQLVRITRAPDAVATWRGVACLLLHRHNERLENFHELQIPRRAHRRRLRARAAAERVRDGLGQRDDGSHAARGSPARARAFRPHRPPERPALPPEARRRVAAGGLPRARAGRSRHGRGARARRALIRLRPGLCGPPMQLRRGGGARAVRVLRRRAEATHRFCPACGAPADVSDSLRSLVAGRCRDRLIAPSAQHRTVRRRRRER